MIGYKSNKFFPLAFQSIKRTSTWRKHNKNCIDCLRGYYERTGKTLCTKTYTNWRHKMCNNDDDNISVTYEMVEKIFFFWYFHRSRTRLKINLIHVNVFAYYGVCKAFRQHNIIFSTCVNFATCLEKWIKHWFASLHSLLKSTFYLSPCQFGKY